MWGIDVPKSQLIDIYHIREETENFFKKGASYSHVHEKNFSFFIWTFFVKFQNGIYTSIQYKTFETNIQLWEIWMIKTEGSVGIKSLMRWFQ